jgi:hypothetical protein
MNRSLAYIGIGVILAGFALASFPIVVYGAETFDVEQESGTLIAPVGLVVVLLAAVAPDPRRTTVVGAFGNPDETVGRERPSPAPPTAPRRYDPKAAVACRHCRTYIPAELAQCPRCARARDCRSCGRPLGLVLDRATCPRCARPEASCGCSILDVAIGPTPRGNRAWGG